MCHTMNIDPQTISFIIGKNRSNLKNIADYALRKTNEKPFIDATPNSTLLIHANHPDTLQCVIQYISVLEDFCKNRQKYSPFGNDTDVTPNSHSKPMNYYKFDQTPPPPFVAQQHQQRPPVPSSPYANNPQQQTHSSSQPSSFSPPLHHPSSQPHHHTQPPHPQYKKRKHPTPPTEGQQQPPLPTNKIIHIKKKNITEIPEYIPAFANGKQQINT